jgi:hypothetical protein
MSLLVVIAGAFARCIPGDSARHAGVAEQTVFALKYMSERGARRLKAIVMSASSRTLSVQTALLSSVSTRERGAIIAIGDGRDESSMTRLTA